jgi:DNA-binding transcriptional ArsR family regulator
MFSSLKHPARRKILRVLADKPLGFSEMLELLGISSSDTGEVAQIKTQNS